MRLLHEIAIFQTVKSKVIISLFETVKLSVSMSLRNLFNSLNSIKENMSVDMSVDVLVCVSYGGKTEGTTYFKKMTSPTMKIQFSFCNEITQQRAMNGVLAVQIILHCFISAIQCCTPVHYICTI